MRELLGRQVRCTVLLFALLHVLPAHGAQPIRLAMIEAFSGPFANAGEAVARNLLFAVERVNARGGVKLAGGARPLQLETLDSKGQVEEALTMFRRAADARIPFVLQGNSSAVAAALIDTVNKHNERAPAERVLFLNYSAVDPALTNERCSPWHFRFDAHVGMRMAALIEALTSDAGVSKVYLLNQDYSFGQQVAATARAMLTERAKAVRVVGDELHPVGKVRDFAPYIAKIRASGADTVITGNWGNDLTLLVRAAREAGLTTNFYTFYGNGLGAPAALGDAGVGRVFAVAEWHPNASPQSMEGVYQGFRGRFPQSRDDFFQARTTVMVEMLVRAIEAAGTVEALAVARALSGMTFSASQGNPLGRVTMRSADHQLFGPLVVSVMDRQGTYAVRYDVEGSGYGFRSRLVVASSDSEHPTRCQMNWPAR
ncbi:MAG TPA: branched-chain amino acid ABC transporter substrate-binding protein [Burkholderiaceae bacterium]|nr:branched-chain amino acid ABC transporter substrate-binding protein [Burkholderiaceae bacterium]